MFYLKQKGGHETIDITASQTMKSLWIQTAVMLLFFYDPLPKLAQRIFANSPMKQHLQVAEPEVCSNIFLELFSQSDYDSS